MNRNIGPERAAREQSGWKAARMGGNKLMTDSWCSGEYLVQGGCAQFQSRGVFFFGWHFNPLYWPEILVKCAMHAHFSYQRYINKIPPGLIQRWKRGFGGHSKAKQFAFIPAANVY